MKEEQRRREDELRHREIKQRIQEGKNQGIILNKDKSRKKLSFSFLQ